MNWRWRLIPAMVVLAGCGLQLYETHQLKAEQLKLTDELRQMEDAEHRVREATRRLQELQKKVPQPQPCLNQAAQHHSVRL